MTPDEVPATTADRQATGGDVALDRRVLQLWRVRAGLAAAAAGASVVAALLATGAPVLAYAAAAAVAIAVAGGVGWWTERVWRSWSFRIGTHALHIGHGVLTHRRSTIPFHRVQHIDLEAGPLERRLGLTTFVLRTAAASSDATVPGIDAADADALRLEILALVGSGDAV